jgi:signal transduction histidine kinase
MVGVPKLRWWRAPLVVDSLLALAVLLVALPGTFDDPEAPARPPAIVVPLVLLVALPLAFRRQRPVTVLAATLAAAIVLDLAYESFPALGPLVALYSVAAHLGRPASLRVVAATGAALLLTLLDERGAALVPSATVLVLFGAAWLLGDNLRTRRAYLRELEERAARLEREREENARRAVADEQARIARELHDVIAHNVSVMTIQAAAGGDVFETHPARAREALGSIESTGRDALTELRRLLGALRGRENGDAARAPQPGLARLDGLLDQVRASGVPVELVVEGEPRELPALVDLSAYRIVQEGLTNVLKHARASRVTVTVRYRPSQLEVDVVDDGEGERAADHRTGRGIIGMRERVALLGGELAVGTAAPRGFAVRARLPIDGSAA